MIRQFFKNVLCVMLIVAGAQTGNAQTAGSPQVDLRITEVYGTYVQQLSKDQLAWIRSQLERSEIKKMPVSATETYPLLSRLELVTKYNAGVTRDEPSVAPLKINPLKYAINFHNKEDLYFRIDGTDYVLWIKAQQ